MLIIPDVEVDERRLADICDRYGIAELKIFGSQAHGTAGPDSDIDVLYTSAPGAGWAGRSSNSQTSSATCSAARSTWCRCAPCTRCCSPQSWPKPSPSMQRDILLLTEMIDAAEQAQRLTADITVSQLENRPPAP